MGLRLIPAAHNSESDVNVILLEEGRNDGMKRPFMRRESVRMTPLERKQRAAIVQHEPRAFRHKSGTEAAEVALNQRNDVPHTIDGGHIDRVTAWLFGDGS